MIHLIQKKCVQTSCMHENVPQPWHPQQPTTPTSTSTVYPDSGTHSLILTKKILNINLIFVESFPTHILPPSHLSYLSLTVFLCHMLTFTPFIYTSGLIIVIVIVALIFVFACSWQSVLSSLADHQYSLQVTLESVCHPPKLMILRSNNRKKTKKNPHTAWVNRLHVISIMWHKLHQKKQ